MTSGEKNFSDEISQVSSSHESRISDIVPETNYVDALDKLEVLPRILQEGILFVGSGPALLLQASLPGIKNRLSNVPSNDGTDTAASPSLAVELSCALQATLSYMACLVFGTHDEKQILLDRLRSGHPPLPVSETIASHPPTQLWMIATLYATATDLYQRIYGAVDYRTAQKGYAEFSLLTRCLGMQPGLWPQSRKAFWSYWDGQIEQVSVSADAHRFAYDLKTRNDLPRCVAVMKPFLRVFTIEMLPPHLRDAYGLKSTVTTRSLYRTTMGISAAVYPALPKSLRSYPVRYYLNELRKHLNG